MPDLSSYTSETIDLLLNRVSVRKYADKPVAQIMVDAILEAAFRAPTSSNIQAYSVVVDRDHDTLQKLSAVTGGQKHVANTPVFLAFCADLTRIQAAMKMNGGSIEVNSLETGLVASIDATLVGMSASLVAESLGLKGLMIGAVRNNASETAKILNLPKQVFCAFGMCLGWPAEEPPQKPRMAQAAMVHHEQYGNHENGQTPDALLNTYDRDLSAHYISINKPTTTDSWTHDIAKKFSPEPRANLRKELKDQGFDFS